MNYTLVFHILGLILRVEAVLPGVDGGGAVGDDGPALPGDGGHQHPGLEAQVLEGRVQKLGVGGGGELHRLDGPAQGLVEKL